MYDKKIFNWERMILLQVFPVKTSARYKLFGL